MLNLKSVPLMAIAGLLVACCEAPPPPMIDLVAEAASVRERSASWNEAVIAGDLDAVMEFYAPDAVQMVAGRPPVVGKEAIRSWFEEWLFLPDLENTFGAEAVEVAASGDMAFERGTWKVTVETPEGPVEDFGKYFAVWKKVDGQWYAAADISHSDAAAGES